MDEETLASVALRAAQTGTLTGWVNNAAVFRDAALPDTPLAEVMAFVTTNLGLAVAGSAAAVRCFLADGTPRRDRQCLVSSGPARGARGAALRHRQGRH